MSTYSSSSSPERLCRSRILSSKLYFDVPPSKVPLIYSSAYNISFLGMEKLHPFDSSKWGRICQLLASAGVLDKRSIVEPEEASKEDLLVVHPETYLDSLKSSLIVAKIVEVPPVAMLPNCIIQRKILDPFRKQVGGSVLAAKLAKERGWAINIGGGFHHCSADKGGGFCAYADISLCIHFAFVRLNISRVAIIDLDAHQGNGHEIDFAEDKRVYILDIYNSEVYPSDFNARRYIDQKVELMSGTMTDVYLKKLDDALEVARQMFDPELVVYNAGTDILEGDPLGSLRVICRENENVTDPARLPVVFTYSRKHEKRKGLGENATAELDNSVKISPDGIIKRDEKVFAFARDKGIPILMLTSGGYMKSSARVIADSIINLSRKKLIDMAGSQNTAGTGL